MNNLKEITSALVALNDGTPVRKKSITKQVTLLIGPPCSGKSTYIKDMDFDFIVSSDNIVEKVCHENALTYEQFFKLGFHHPLRKKQRSLFRYSVEDSKQYQSVVWDLTNLTVKDRKKAMSHYPGADFQAFDFKFNGYEKELLEINKQRGTQQGKVISSDTILTMIDKYEPITKAEGYDFVWPIDVIPLAIPFNKSMLNEENLRNFRTVVENSFYIEFMEAASVFNIEGPTEEVHKYLTDLNLILGKIGLGVTHIEDVSDNFQEDGLVDYDIETNLPRCKFEQLMAA